MLRLFTYTRFLNKVLNEKAPKNLFKILESGYVNYIHLPEKECNTIGPMGMVGNLIGMFDSFGTKILYNDAYLQDISLYHEMFTSYPFAIYILDIEPEKAKKISKDYGVICMSSNGINEELLSLFYEFNVEEDTDDVSWSNFMDCGARKIPSSSMIITDRYLFSGEGAKNKDIALTAVNLGLENIHCILSNVLPRRFLLESYPIYIIFDSSKIKYENDPFKDDKNKCFENEALRIIEEDLTNYKKPSSIRKYPLKFYLISIDNTPESHFLYKLTHNRKIVTNYFLIRCDHKIRAFDGAKSETTQTLRFDAMFSRIEKNQDNGPHSPIVSIEQTLRCLKKISNLRDIRYYYDVSNPEQSSLSELRKHPLIKQIHI